MNFRDVLIALTCFNLFNHILLVTLSPQVPPGQLSDTDAYMRLVRVETLLAGASWQDQTIPRSNAPYGETLHWSRPLDVLIIAGALPLRLFLPRHEAIYWSGYWISPLLMTCSLLLLVWSARRLSAPRDAFHLGILFLCQAAILGYHLGGRADHHSLLVCAFCATIAASRPIWDTGVSPRRGLLPGALIGIGAWVSIEALVYLLPPFLYLGLRWLRDPSPRHARCACWTALGAAAISLAAIVTETPGQLLHPTLPDRLNSAHTAGLIIAAGFWSLLARLRPLPSLRTRLLYSALLASSGLAAWGLLFPVIRESPYGLLDPRLRNLWLAQVTEVLPLVSSWREAPARLCAWLFPMLATLLFLLFRPSRRAFQRALQRPIGLLWLAATLVFTVLSFRQIRWVIYAEILWLFPYAHLMNQGLAAWQGNTTGIRRRLGSLLLILAFCGAYIPCYLLANLLIPPPLKPPGTAENLAPLRDFCRAFNDLSLPPVPRIAAHIDYGPELLYRTRAEVIATPYHGNSQGMLFWYESMHLPPADALVRLRGRGVTHLLLSTLPAEQVFLQTFANPDSLYETLRRGGSVEGIAAVPLPDALREAYHLYTVIPPEPAAPPPPPAAFPPPTMSPPPAPTAPSTPPDPSTSAPPPGP